MFITQVLLSNKYKVGRLEPGRGLKLVSTAYIIGVSRQDQVENNHGRDCVVDLFFFFFCVRNLLEGHDDDACVSRRPVAA